MSLDPLQMATTINELEIFLDRNRPPEEMRNELDISYRIENQSILIFEIRPHWQRKTEIQECPIAKTTWVKSQSVWKIYWMRADLKWHLYEPNPTVKAVEDFLKTVNEDAYACFWG